jgi:diguanylate cyclase (GGDEF)-like protein/PAS domain S-box-containing protein
MTGNAGDERPADRLAERPVAGVTAAERDIFERIAADAALPAVLTSIIGLVESLGPDLAVAIGRVDAQAQRFIEILGERVPLGWRQTEQGMPVDLRNGSSAAAVYLGRAVLVSNIATDPYWHRHRAQAHEQGFQAAWAVPISAARGRILGALTVYRTLCGAPGALELSLMTHAAQIAGIAIERHNSAAALRESEARYRSLYEHVPNGVYQCSADGRLKAVNPALVRMLGYREPSQLYALPGMVSLYRDAAHWAALTRELSADGAIHNVETLMQRADGTSLVVLESAWVIRARDGQIEGIEGTLSDISARKSAEQAMFAAKERAQVTLQSIGDAVITTDREGRIDYMNPVAERLTGWQSQDARGERLPAVMRLHDERADGEAGANAVDHPLWRCLAEGQTVHSADYSMLVNRQGHEIAIQDSAAPIRDRAGQIAGAVVVFRDVTKERRLKRALAYQASHDALTGLINRRELDNRLAEALRTAHEQQGPHALLYMDLDQFKRVNDACGHGAGDRLLRDITGLLQGQVRAGDTIARLGGDEFGVLMQHCTAAEAEAIAENIRQSIQDYRFSWDQHTSRIGVSIGVVEINAESQNVATLLSAADIACYTAKEGGRNRVHRYDSHLDAGRQRDLYWVGRLTRALEQGRLELFCQPIVPMGSRGHGQPPFYEVLTRLRDDDGELVLPRHFIPAAERYNVVSAIDRWALESALEVMRERQAGGARAAGSPGAPGFQLALNLSGMSFGDRDFLEFVLARIDDSVARALCFEISESAVLKSMTEAVEFMKELRQRGCRFALADFGGDLSSFRYLRTLPVDFIKLHDRCTSRVLTDPLDRCLVEAVSRAARALGIATVAEKVESAAVFAELQRLEVQFAQGMFIAPPEPIALLHSRYAGAAALSPGLAEPLISLRH